MKTITSLILSLAAIYFSIHLALWGIDLHQQAVERQQGKPIEMHRNTK